ncbi:rhythmically expressed gene 2 protein [Drosophila grimshawi]|uniref:GH17703 n=1 Tax=Drosophila grimshawi TaxID=7222 RepID=B4JWS5_DROGR|nr:rhythmically expressed gene 2 protein [Drosophila grimshawi]EDV95201.1 GH17703 [Drosophila grimshawi]
MSLPAQFVRNIQRFRLVTFDVTDTLLRLKDPIAQYALTAAACGVSITDNVQLKRCFHQQFKLMSNEHSNFGLCSPNMNWQSWWSQLVVNTFNCVDASIPNTKLQTITEQLLAIFQTSACWSHIDGALDLVQRVRDAGKCVGVISNFDPSLPQVLSAMGLADKFDFILSSYEAGVMKPDPGIFKAAIGNRPIAPAQALHIGNKFDIDYMGARNSGWSSLLVLTQPESAPEAANHSFTSLAEMLQALETQKITW